MWCRLCGKYTNNMKHIRLKITKNRCAKEGGVMLEQEGFHHNENHLDLLERELNLKYNTAKHVLLWNRRTGKTIDAEDEGKLECLKCGRQCDGRIEYAICRERNVLTSNLRRFPREFRANSQFHVFLPRRLPLLHLSCHVLVLVDSLSGMESSRRGHYYSNKHQLLGPCRHRSQSSWGTRMR